MGFPSRNLDFSLLIVRQLYMNELKHFENTIARARGEFLIEDACSHPRWGLPSVVVSKCTLCTTIRTLWNFPSFADNARLCKRKTASPLRENFDMNNSMNTHEP